ncbi:MAG: M20/M25/M40 family metallo-hydrolase [Burkholderiaceae bacterium]
MIRSIKRILAVLALAAVVLAGVLAWNTWRAPSRQLAVTPVAPVPVDVDGAAGRLSRAVQFQTISFDGAPSDSAPALQAFRGWLQATYPAVHATLTRELVAEHSLLFTWPGTDPALAPILLMAHQDVVPIAPGTLDDWTEPPFAGVRRDGFVWGRGAWDDKGNLIAQLEAVEALIGQGFAPRRTILLAFGHDEEIGGQGAKAIAALLQSRGVRLHFVLDEGLLITGGILPGSVRRRPQSALPKRLPQPGPGVGHPGHSSMPGPGEGAIAMMSAALAAIENRQFPRACGAWRARCSTSSRPRCAAS